MSASSRRFRSTKTADFVPLRKTKGSIRGFVGDALLILDDEGKPRLENPEDGTPLASNLGAALENLAVTRSFIAVLDTARPRVIARADGSERPVGGWCPPGAELRALTAAATAGQRVAIDVECQRRGAPPCTGARDKGASILDTATWSVSPLEGASGVATYAPNSSRVAVGRGVWDVRSRRRIATLPGE